LVVFTKQETNIYVNTARITATRTPMQNKKVTRLFILIPFSVSLIPLSATPRDFLITKIQLSNGIKKRCAGGFN